MIARAINSSIKVKPRPRSRATRVRIELVIAGMPAHGVLVVTGVSSIVGLGALGTDGHTYFFDQPAKADVGSGHCAIRNDHSRPQPTGRGAEGAHVRTGPERRDVGRRMGERLEDEHVVDVRGEDRVGGRGVHLESACKLVDAIRVGSHTLLNPSLQLVGALLDGPDQIGEKCLEASWARAVDEQ